LGAFLSLAKDLGMAAKRTIDVDVFTLLASNPLMVDGIALFHAAHGNLASTGSIVSVVSVDQGRVAMSLQKDVSGNDFLDLTPVIWLGSKATGGTARVVNDAQYDPDTPNKLQMPNRVRGQFSNIIDSPRITGTEWYQFADPLVAPVIEVAFYNGIQEPFLASQQGFTMDGIQWVVRLDYGIAAIDYRGGYKNPGASS
ncbi:MAG: hypothetical protein PHU14_09930, partial [Methylovulum sp.]|nr:hypothetical protein [Methylovulum sp.]